MKRINKIETLEREKLITAILKSEINAEEHSNNNTDNDTYDGKIRGKICDIKMILGRLGDIVINKNRRKITKELYEIEKKQNLSDGKKEDIYDHLVELVNTLDKKEKYEYHDRDDLYYYGIKDI